MTALPAYATDADSREMLLNLARGYADGSIREELVHSLVPLYASALAENVFHTFFQLVIAAKEVREWDEDPNAYGVNHGLRREEWLETGKRLSSEQEALLSRLCGGVA